MKVKTFHFFYSTSWKLQVGFILLLMLPACLTKISLDVPATNSPNLAITAFLLKENPSNLNVTVAKVSNFVANDFPEPITNAVVKLIAQGGAEVQIPHTAKGQYEREFPTDDPSFLIEVGQSYQVQVVTAEGKTYASTFEHLHAVPKPTGLSFTVENRQTINEIKNIVNQQFIRFYIYTPLSLPGSEEKAVFKWNVEGTYRFIEPLITVGVPNSRICYITNIMQRDQPIVFNGLESSQSVLNQHYLMEEKMDYRFSQGFYISVFQQSISESAFIYWNQIDKIVGLSGNFFDASPGKIKGNFHNLEDSTEDVFGYFYTASQDTIRMFISQSEFEVAPKAICPVEVPNIDSIPPGCENCLEIPNSTLQRPAFWIE
ncbi:MAG: DUF4249 family protein [Saprospiraceae bacterium]